MPRLGRVDDVGDIDDGDAASAGDVVDAGAVGEREHRAEAERAEVDVDGVAGKFEVEAVASSLADWWPASCDEQREQKRLRKRWAQSFANEHRRAGYRLGPAAGTGTSRATWSPRCTTVGDTACGKALFWYVTVNCTENFAPTSAFHGARNWCAAFDVNA